MKPKIFPVSGVFLSHRSEVSHTLPTGFLFAYTSATSDGSISLFNSKSFNHLKYYKSLWP
jgi:hypothetical protein